MNQSFKFLIQQIKTQHNDDDAIDDPEPMVSITSSKPESEDPQDPISKLLDFNETIIDKSDFFYVVDSISKNIKVISFHIAI